MEWLKIMLVSHTAQEASPQSVLWFDGFTLYARHRWSLWMGVVELASLDLYKSLELTVLEELFFSFRDEDLSSSAFLYL